MVLGASKVSSSRLFFIAPIMGGGPVCRTSLISAVLALASRADLGLASGAELKATPNNQLTAEEHLSIRSRRRKVLLDHISRDEALAPSPLGRRLVKDVVDRETLGVLLGQAVELGFEQDILQLDVGVDE